MKVYFASDHAGFELKQELLNFVRGELSLEVEDCGAFSFDENDDYPALIKGAIQKLSEDFANGVKSRAIVLGASGQGEAIVANRFAGIRAGVFYGDVAHAQIDQNGRTLDMVSSIRMHNDTNVLSLGARFISGEQAKTAVKEWLTTPFSEEARHIRRIEAIDA